MTLTPEQIKTFYDHFGERQDAQGFYEDPALDALIAHADFEHAGTVFEFGCGTGRLALGLLAHHLPATANFVGCDVSATMVGLASQRLADYAGRTCIMQAGGNIAFPLIDGAADRVVATYVLDLLAPADIDNFLREAHRVLAAHGKLCLVSLTHGNTLVTKLVSSIWSALYRLRAAWVGGCRPVNLVAHLNPDEWTLEYRRVISAWGVPSEVLVVRAKAAAAASDGLADL